MGNDDGDLESRICGALPSKDIRAFAVMMFDVNRGNPVHPEGIASLPSYGATFSEISKKFRTHLNACFHCNDYFKDELNVWEFPLSQPFYSDPEKQAAFERKTELYRWFLIEHENIPQRNELQRYVVEYYKEKTSRPEFEEHIKACSMCTEYVSVRAKLKDSK